MTKRDRIVCFAMTREQFAELHQVASTKDSLSSLLREIIQRYLDDRRQDQALDPAQR